MYLAFPFPLFEPNFEASSFPARMFSRGLLACIMVMMPVALLLSLSVAAESPQENASPAGAPARSCKAILLESTSIPANSAESLAKSSAGTTTTDTSTSCIEVRASSLQIQKFVQGFARDRAWNLGQQQTSEDSWSFVRLLQKDELSRLAKTEIMGGQINWTEGKVFVNLSTMDTGESYTRVKISARFEGRGQSSKGFATPNSVWKLISKGTLEGELLAALESHFRSPH